MSKSKSSSGGIGLCGLIFCIFLFLKLAEIGQVATWSWWAVTSPLWIPTLIIFTIIIILLIIVGIAALFKLTK